MECAEVPTYFTVSDERYFLGTVALVNSLALSGNEGTVVVIDSGLTADQRARLSAHCDVRPLPVDRQGAIPIYFKPTVAMLDLRGIVVFLDSDMIVTADLRQLYSPAASGVMCVFPDGMPDRRFDEWKERLGLAADLRRQVYVNSGFVAFDFDVWSKELGRWWDLCNRARHQRSDTPWGVEPREVAGTDPFLWGDQDVLNAILMSEVEPERIHVLDGALVGVPDWPRYDGGAQITNRASLSVDNGGRPLSILHYWAQPKPWFPYARRRLVFGAYVELAARVLTADDVPIPLPRRLVPLWLRDDIPGKTVRRLPRIMRGSAKRVIATLPHSLEQPVRSAAERVADRRHKVNH